MLTRPPRAASRPKIVLIVVAVWVALSVVLALLIGAIIKLRDRREAPTATAHVDLHAVGSTRHHHR